MTPAADLILASASPRRAALLARIGMTPSEIMPADIDEAVLPGELPRPYAERMATTKARAIAARRQGALVLGSDTVVCLGRRILPKTETRAEAEACLSALSGRRHRVMTSVCLAQDGRTALRTSETRVAMKRLSQPELHAYLDSEEWRGVAGGYAIQGAAEALIKSISGSHSGVVGLPLFETAQLLKGWTAQPAPASGDPGDGAVDHPVPAA